MYPQERTTAEGRECALCNEYKTKDHFHRNKRYKSGLASYCKECQRTYGSRYAKENGEARKVIARRHNLKRQYGLTEADYDQMLADQGGVCAICEEGQERRRLAVDHCHATGKVRGLLCDNCNHGIGKFKDDINRLEAAITYLKKT